MFRSLSLLLILSAACVADTEMRDLLESSEGEAAVLGTYVHDDCEGAEGARCKTSLTLAADGAGVFVGVDLTEEITWARSETGLEAELPWGATRFEMGLDGWLLVDDRYGLDWYRVAD